MRWVSTSLGHPWTERDCRVEGALGRALSVEENALRERLAAEGASATALRGGVSEKLKNESVDCFMAADNPPGQMKPSLENLLVVLAAQADVVSLIETQKALSIYGNT